MIEQPTHKPNSPEMTSLDREVPVNNESISALLTDLVDVRLQLHAIRQRDSVARTEYPKPESNSELVHFDYQGKTLLILEGIWKSIRYKTPHNNLGSTPSEMELPNEETVRDALLKAVKEYILFLDGSEGEAFRLEDAGITIENGVITLTYRVDNVVSTSVSSFFELSQKLVAEMKAYNEKMPLPVEPDFNRNFNPEIFKENSPKT